MVPGRYISIEVTDSGCGMSDAIQTKIFEPFFTTKFLGRGLGLAAVAGIVRAHNWGVSVNSAPGEGSTFQVFLPAAATETRAPESSDHEDAIDASGSASILVVDDEDIVRRTAKLALERHGYHVFVADSGAAALRLCQNEARGVDLVLLDLSMPGMSGQETFAALREIDPGVKVLISSGYSESEAMRTFSGHKPAGFVQKPYTALRLASTVKKAVAHG
jgi:CheY-like chemotaxis protein